MQGGDAMQKGTSPAEGKGGSAAADDKDTAAAAVAAAAATAAAVEPPRSTRERKKGKKSGSKSKKGKKGGAAAAPAAPVLPRARILFHNCPHKRSVDGEWIALVGDGLKRFAAHHTHTVVTSDKQAGWQQQLDAASSSAAAAAGASALLAEGAAAAGGGGTPQLAANGASGANDRSADMAPHGGAGSVGADGQSLAGQPPEQPSVDDLLHGSPWYVAMEDETPSAIANKLGVSAKALVALNKERYKGLQAGSRLKARTKLLVPAREGAGGAAGGGSAADGTPAVACHAVAGFDLGLGVWGNAAGITMLGGGAGAGAPPGGGKGEGSGASAGRSRARPSRDGPAIVIPDKKVRGTIISRVPPRSPPLSPHTHSSIHSPIPLGRPRLFLDFSSTLPRLFLDSSPACRRVCRGAPSPRPAPTLPACRRRSASRRRPRRSRRSRWA